MGRENWAEPISEKMKEEVIVLLKKGKSNKEIRKAFHYRISNSAIGAIRAHLGKLESYDRETTPIPQKIKDEMRHMTVVEGKDSLEIYHHYKKLYKRIQIAGILAALKRQGML